jgi:hypothetical protein
MYMRRRKSFVIENYGDSTPGEPYTELPGGANNTVQPLLGLIL